MSAVLPDRLRRGVLRRWWSGRRAATPPAATPGTDADLLADIVAMTGQAAVDGLPLSAVLEDLRLVLGLDPADALPVDALRACALEWASSCSDPRAVPAHVPVTPDELESHLWRVLGSAPEQLPGLVVQVQPRTSGDPLTGPGTAGVLDQAVLLGVAARTMAQVFDRAGEHVALLKPTPAASTDRAVALVPGPLTGDDGDDGDRLTLLRASLASSPATGIVPWAVEAHVLAGHPSGLLARLRHVLELG
jgi:hypothetical protein